MLKQNLSKEIKFYQDRKWDQLKIGIRETPFTLLDRAQKLINEGIQQNNCVGTYVEQAGKNQCCILNYIEPDTFDHYTIEVRANKKKKKMQWQYQIQQYLLKNNELPKDNHVEKMLLSLIN